MPQKWILFSQQIADYMAAARRDQNSDNNQIDLFNAGGEIILQGKE